MICPMKFNNSKVWEQHEGSEEKQYTCHKEQCAWWTDEYGSCAIKDIALALNSIRRNFDNNT